MTLTNEERAYVQGMQEQIFALQKDVQELRAIIQQMREQAIYEQGQRASPIGINPLGGRQYGMDAGGGKIGIDAGKTEK